MRGLSKRNLQYMMRFATEWDIDVNVQPPYAQEATDYLSDRVLYYTVILTEDVQLTDRYNRSLVYVYLEDGTFINAELVEKGWATTMTVPPNVKFADLFRELQSEAREKQIGIWQK